MLEKEFEDKDAFKNELIDTSIDTTIDYLEIGIDAFLKEGLFQDIPIVRTLYSVYKIGNTIRDAHFVKKMMIFLKEFRESKIDEKELVAFKKKMNEDKKYKKKVTEQIILLLDRYESSFKAVLYGKLLAAYINNYLNWETFQFFSSCIDSLLKNDFQVLEQLYKSRDGKKISTITIYHLDKMMIISSIERLQSLGFVTAEDDQKKGDYIITPIERKYKASDLGNRFYHHCLLKHADKLLE